MFDRTSSASWRIVTAVFMAAIVVAGCNTPIEPNPDLCDNIAGIQLTVPDGMVKEGRNCVPAPPELGTVTAAFDTPNPVIVQGDPVSCPRVEVIGSKNLPPGYVLDTALFLEDGMPVSCGSIAGVGPQLVSGNPPEPATAKLAIGPHSVTARVTLRGTDIKAESQQVGFTVAKKLYDQILVRIVEAAYPNSGCSDLWSVDAVSGATLRRLTTGCGKGTFALTRDGKTLWYTESNDSNRVWKANADGSNAVSFSIMWDGKPVTVISNLRVSPDGSKLAFAGIPHTDGYSRTFVMNADGAGLRSILDYVSGSVYTPDGTSAWMPDGRLMVARDSSGMIGNTYRIVKEEYIIVDLETGEGQTVFVSKYGEDQFGSSLRRVSDDGRWFLLWEISTTGRATIVRTDGSGEVRPLTEKYKNASLPIFCGEAVCAASNPTTVFRVELDGQNREVMFTVTNGWVADLGFLKGSGS